MMWERLHQLAPRVQEYPWGARGHDGRPPYIARLLGQTPPDDRPYAELWIGGHPALPCTLSVDGQTRNLDEVVAEYPREILGSGLADTGLRSLPLLLKILDCEAPLSIQAHPNKVLARMLNQRHPEHYPDANHKPEIAVALTPFRALCRFRERQQIQHDLRRHSGLAALLCDQLDDVDEPSWLRRAYRRLFEASSMDIERALCSVTEALADGADVTREDLCFLDLARHCPGDRGALCTYFLNLLELAPGEAIFLAADEPHAYLNGTIVECMANSNNVVRAGLTSKFMDVPVLLDMLTYEEALPRIWRGEEMPGGGRRFEVPVSDFEVEIWEGATGEEWTIHSGDAVSLLLVLDGTVAFCVPGQEEILAETGSCWLWPGALSSCRMKMEAENVRVVRAKSGF